MFMSLKGLAKMPIRATQGSAGFDIFAMEDVYLLKRATVKVPTGIRMQIPDGDYHGEICVLLKNNNDREFVIKTDLAIAQLVFLQCFSPQLFIVVPEEELTSTGRGIGGFGSTDCMQRI
nr:deoxyuridine 5'-triphosphate nucleotidohydrolase-like [Hydra vulgaris]